MYERNDVKKFLAKRVARPASAGVIIENGDSEALVLKAHYKPYWSFPGGWIEHGQTPRQAALRELLEETNIALSKDDLVLAFAVDRSSDIMQTYQFIFQAPTARVEAEDIILQESEIADFQYISKQHVLENKNEFGGAVIAWAESSSTRYYEHTID